ncbi:MAG: universal stress protein [Acidobacteriota bacterium]|nr:universal stress protein [Blastocatellia bacterium]MDW8413389.1 universal stress protein [Acidobacteriota bacterium]
MYPFRNILLPTNFSPNCRSAIKYAAAFGHRYGAAIYLHNAQEGSLPPQALLLSDRTLSEHGYDWITAIKKELKELSEHPLFKGLNVHLLLSEGSAASEIKRMTEVYNIDLITMATSSKSGLKSRFAGSCAVDVMLSTNCPILFTRTAMHDFVYHHHGEIKLALNRILFATNLSQDDEAAKRLAIQLARDNDAELKVLHCLGSIIKYFSALSLSDKAHEHLKEQAFIKLDEIRKEADKVAVETILSEDRFHQELERISTEKEIDLIVIGSDAHRSSGFSSSGSGAERVIRTATRPVLVVKNL